MRSQCFLPPILAVEGALIPMSRLLHLIVEHGTAILLTLAFLALSEHELRRFEYSNQLETDWFYSSLSDILWRMLYLRMYSINIFLFCSFEIWALLHLICKEIWLQQPIHLMLWFHDIAICSFEHDIIFSSVDIFPPCESLKVSEIVHIKLASCVESNKSTCNILKLTSSAKCSFFVSFAALSSMKVIRTNSSSSSSTFLAFSFSLFFLLHSEVLCPFLPQL